MANRCLPCRSLTPKRFRRGHFVGIFLMLLLFVYDQVQLSRELQALSTVKCSYYPEFTHEGPITPSFAGGPNNFDYPNQVVHFADFGLGHRLSKISSAWHLTKALNLTRMVLFWGDCKGYPINIAPQLFGSDSIDVPGTEHIALEAKRSGNLGKTIKLKNDVAGYYDGENYKKHKVLLPKNIRSVNSPWLEKYKSDVELYRILLKRFVGKENAIKFMEEKRFKEHFVVGIHLRLGNGEKAHFAQAGRIVDNETEFVSNLLTLLKAFVDDIQTSHPHKFQADECLKTAKSKVPLFFLATDSPKYITIIQDYTKKLGIDTVVIPQARINHGVTFTVKKGRQCAQGWYDMLLDDIVLSFSDVLVAARYSTFTQSMPMPLVFDRASGTKGPHFCEVGDTGTVMTCLEDMRTWMFRDNPMKTFTYSTEKNSVAREVIHHMTVHLPDVELPDPFFEAVEFLNPSPNLQTATKGGVHGQAKKPRRTITYGEDSLSWFDTKYRKSAVCSSCIDFSYE